MCVGGHWHSDTDPCRIEELREGGALIEDCRTGVLIDASASELRRLKPVRPSASETPSG